MCKVKYSKEDEEGRLKSVTEPYLVDALSFTEAETRIYEELGSVIKGDFLITGISKTKISDIFHMDGEHYWHKCKVVYFVSMDNGKEKKVTNQMLINAKDVKEAYDLMIESLSTMMVTYKITEIIETPIAEIFPYYGDDEVIDNRKTLPNPEPLPPVVVDEDGVVQEDEEDELEEEDEIDEQGEEVEDEDENERL